MLKNFFCILLTVLIFTSSLSAQEAKEIVKKIKGVAEVDTSQKKKEWLFGGISLLTFFQDYTKNWAVGGDPALSVKGSGNYYIKYRKNRIMWDNTIDIDYGMQRNLETKLNTKTTDKLEIASNLGFRLGGMWNCASLAKFQTQISDGYTNEVVSSAFMTPAYFIISLGMEYKRNDWGMFISPITGKMTFKNDSRFLNKSYFGVDSGLTVTYAFGGYARLTVDHNFSKMISLYSKLELFADYLEEMDKIDVNLEMRWIFKITEWLSLSMYASMVYDYDVKFDCYDSDGNIRYRADGTIMQTDHLQFKENFGLALTNKFAYDTENRRNKK